MPDVPFNAMQKIIAYMVDYKGYGEYYYNYKSCQKQVTVKAAFVRWLLLFL
jgi:hypothetical protein